MKGNNVITFYRVYWIKDGVGMPMNDQTIEDILERYTQESVNRFMRYVFGAENRIMVEMTSKIDGQKYLIF